MTTCNRGAFKASFSTSSAVMPIRPYVFHDFTSRAYPVPLSAQGDGFGGGEGGVQGNGVGIDCHSMTLIQSRFLSSQDFELDGIHIWAVGDSGGIYGDGDGNSTTLGDVNYDRNSVEGADQFYPYLCELLGLTCTS